MQIISKFGFSTKSFIILFDTYSRSKIFISLLFLNESKLYSLTIWFETKHLLISSRSSPQFLHVLSFPPYFRERNFLLRKITYFSRKIKLKNKSKTYVEWEGNRYSTDAAFFIPTFTKRMTSLCKWSGCRLGNKSLVICMFCLFIYRFCFGYIITII